MLRRRRFAMVEQDSPREKTALKTVRSLYTPLPTLTRRRLYSRLLVLGSGTVAKFLGSFISRFLFLRSAAKHSQVCFRHTRLLYYVSLQRSNQFVTVRNTRSLFVGRRLLLSTWVMVSDSVVRLVFTSLAWSVRVLGVPQSRNFCFFV